MQCHHFDAARCRSCTLIEQPYAEQLAAKQERCADLLAPFGPLEWLPPVASVEQGFRNKAKLAVGGTVDAPTLGILDPGGVGVDLRDCGLYPATLQAALPVLASFVTRARLVPYDVPTRRGELKYVLVTQSPDGDLMVRFVLRSTEALPRLRKHLPWLLDVLPRAVAVTANLLPEHKAVLEGPEEVVLTERSTLRMRVNDVDLHLRPQSFFQTNTEVAAALYRIGREWVDAAAPRSVWDLYCGVGGFALHVAAPGRSVVGIETSTEAVASAEQSRDDLGLTDVRFATGDATAFALTADAPPDLVVVNPPRRGIGPDLAGWLERSGVRDVVYSSCNAASLARDLVAMPSLRPRRGRLLDMFPQTGHYEVVVALSRG
ncbi:23S rRNA (uracil(747)-C(5))-methyltransferase RlmC [Cellulomonas triticagri]|uniref:23S rRNA (Uracil(747)-C(5))-methyltransferase RlmC n=1 Tax=Cellulomonas triticagri TaxID=2483352 RepID=A0A3M2IXC2_9CELL|nr:23S rRNA (uracil(747)-C(5))-methyltransferase RlmC [Cellulomonas triticagri]RMI03445.1 23S rRNA (uracil(747)-C(5))-methyltransferase RlmC [Cellulomonas triticagri]